MTGYRLAELVRGNTMRPADTDDGNEWRYGFCSLGCRQWARVVATGDVSIPGLHFTLYACGPCIKEFVEQAWAHFCGQPSVEPGAKWYARRSRS